MYFAHFSTTGYQRNPLGQGFADQLGSCSNLLPRT
jgi:hypothetical protein